MSDQKKQTTSPHYSPERGIKKGVSAAQPQHISPQYQEKPFVEGSPPVASHNHFSQGPHPSPIPSASYYPQPPGGNYPTQPPSTHTPGQGYMHNVPRAPHTEREWILGLQNELTALVRDSEDLKQEMREGFKSIGDDFKGIRGEIEALRKDFKEEMERMSQDTEKRVRDLEDARLKDQAKLDKIDQLETLIKGEGGVLNQLIVMNTQQKTLKWIWGVAWPVVALIISLVIAPLAKNFFAEPKKDVSKLERQIEKLQRQLLENQNRKPTKR